MNPDYLRGNAIRFSLILLVILTTPVTALGQAKRPNVVMIVSDDAGYADFGFMNQFTGETTKLLTPRLDDLARQSAVFTNGYVSGPLCAFSRSGFLTGRYSQRFGVEWNYADTTSPEDGLPPGETLLSERMKQLNYTTGAVGKWHLGKTEAHQPQNQGFDEFYGIWDGSRQYFELPGQPPVRRQTTEIAWHTEPSFNNVPNDPTHGRLLTDAFGDEASRFIATHAGEANPFFLYLPFTAPHYPVRWSKASDAAPFYGMGMSVERHIVASLAYGLDRNVGEILDRIDDPNRDGDQSDSIRDNTIVVFINDNGGSPPINGVNGLTETYDNGPLRGYKGSLYEGGIRVPFMIRAPGVDPQVVNDVVTSLDLFPTLVSAAGGAQTTPTDGVDLMPLLKGQQTQAPHDELFWRWRLDGFAVRKGDWKLAKGESNAQISLYRLNADGSGEDLDLSPENPEKVRELIRDYVHWEATLDKLRYTGYSSFGLNQFDEFKQRNISTTINWQANAAWENANNPGQFATMKRWDAAPNTVLVFETRNDANYQSTNNLVRAAGHSTAVSAPTPEGLYEFMLNEVKLQGNFTGAANRSATLQGNPLLFVKSLSNRGPQLSLQANRAIGGPTYTFNVNMDLVLLDDLLITGNGSAAFSIGGVIRDFDAPCSLIKDGSSAISLTGRNTYRGATIVKGGELRLATPAAALAESEMVTIRSGGRLTLSSGAITTDLLSVNPGGVFTFTGGLLETSAVVGNLTNNGGVFAPGPTPGEINVNGNYIQTAGVLNLDLDRNGSSGLSDRLAVTGTAQLNGLLNVSADNLLNYSPGDALPLITATGGLSGRFTSLNAPSLPDGLAWSVHYTSTSATLLVVEVAGSVVPRSYLTRWRISYGIDGGADLDGDGDTDGADLVAWQRGDSMPSAVTSYLSLWRTAYGVDGRADLDGDGDTDGRDLLFWQRMIRVTGSAQMVAEPSSWTLAALALVLSFSRTVRDRRRL